MKKTKLFEVSLINKAYSRVIRDTTRFYTSDTALEIGFKLAEPEYSFDSGVILLLNEEDQSLVSRDLTREGAGFIYTLEDDIIEHYGNWAAQLKFEKDGETYVSSPVGFSIHNDLYNNRPPKLNDVNTWKNLRKIADGLISDIRSEIEALEAQELEIQAAEQLRQSGELSRIENENQRNLTSIEEFIKLQDAIGGRNYLLNSDKPSAISFTSNNSTTIPLTRGVDNGIDYIQQSQSGKFTLSTYIPEVYASYVGTKYSENLNNYTGYVTTSIEIMASVPLKVRFLAGTSVLTTTKANEWTRVSGYTQQPYARPNGIMAMSTDNPDVPADTKVYWRKVKIEKGTQATPYTKAPEDYTTVSKDDYYNHIKLMSDHKDAILAAKANKKQEEWIKPTLLNGWVATDSLAYPVGFYKDEFGIVRLKGRVQGGVGSIFTLPVGYRSKNVVSGFLAQATSSDTPAKVNTTTSGNVSCQNGVTGIYLDGVAFRAEV